MRASRGAAEVCSHPLDPQGCCPASYLTYSSLTEMWESIVCPKEEHDEWHRAECLFGECQDCGIKFLPTCEDEMDGVGDRLVEWRRFAKEECHTKTGKVVQKLALVYKKTLPEDLIEYMKPKLQHFVTHNFVARWEDKQFKACIKGFGRDSVISVVDFAENYKFEIQNEVQSMHWHSYQISILVHISFRHNPEADPYDEDTWILTEYHFYISDDTVHDSLFVQHCFGLHWDYLKAQNFSPKMHYVWSDGCAAQFKSAKPWFFVSRYPNMTNGCGMLWSFFGSGHGKGPHDGAGAVVKCFIRREQLKSDGWRLQNAATVVEFLKQKLSARPESSYLGRRKPMRREFWEVSREDVNKLQDLDCDTISGTRGLHSILATNRNHLTNLQVKKLACFCLFCFDGKWEDCINLHWTGPWMSRYLQPENAAHVRNLMMAPESNVWACDASGETILASTLDIGDNFAVNAAEGNSEGADFWVINCTKTMHAVKYAFTCKWGTSFEVGDEIVAGFYYQRWGTSETSYVLLKNSHPVHMHAHLVRAVKFDMLPKDYRVQGNDLVYDLPACAWNGIKEVIACLHFDDD